METVLTVGFILTATAFFRKVFGIKGYWSLIPAGLVALVAVEWPLLLATFPALAPFLEPVATVIALVVAAAGTFDFSVEVAATPTAKK